MCPRVAVKRRLIERAPGRQVSRREPFPRALHAKSRSVAAHRDGDAMTWFIFPAARETPSTVSPMSCAIGHSSGVGISGRGALRVRRNKIHDRSAPPLTIAARRPIRPIRAVGGCTGSAGAGGGSKCAISLPSRLPRPRPVFREHQSSSSPPNLPSRRGRCFVRPHPARYRRVRQKGSRPRPK